MVRLLVIADDFTGALDCGVQLAGRGCGTKVVAGVPETLDGSEVLVVDAETRHLPPDDAYGVILRLARMARGDGVSCIYKKTDSAMLGNAGAELTALLDGLGERRLAFFPVYLQIGRTVEGGTLFINGMPVAESVFGADPFEPVRTSYIPKLIAARGAAAVTSMPPLTDESELADRDGILVFDASREEDYETACKALAQSGGFRAVAGCADFAGHLAELLGLAKPISVRFTALDSELLIVCGSVDPITVEQIAYAWSYGFYRVWLTPRQKLERGYWSTDDGAAAIAFIRRGMREHPLCIIDVNDTPGAERTDDYARARGMSVSDIHALRRPVPWGTSSADSWTTKSRGAVHHRRRYSYAVHERTGNPLDGAYL